MKMAAEVRWLVPFAIFLVAPAANGNTPHEKFEYKYSFKPPYLAQSDSTVPFWEYGGNAIASAENVRVVPSLRSQKGAIWTKQPINFDWWIVDLVFRVTGRGRLGADGLAFWYTASKGLYNGTVYGSSDMWNGLGVFFDSFDNDNKHNNPYIMAVTNDGTKIFDHTNDGTTQLLAGCLRDFRNKPFPTRAKIRYYQNTLTLLFHNGMTNSLEDYEDCFRVENVHLPKGGYFGVSAATGGLADDHDVLHFLTYSIYAPGQMTIEGRQVSQEDENKIAQEYQDYQKKLEQQKEDYRKEHPDEKHDQEDYENWFETDNQRELRQIYAAHTHMSEMLKEMNRKLDEVVGVQAIGGQPGQRPMPIDTIRRPEVEAVLTNQNLLLNTAREIKSFIGEVASKADTIINYQLRAPTAQVQPIGYDYQSLISEMRDGLNTIKRDIAQSNVKLTGQSGQTVDCPTRNCLTTTMFLTFCVLQMVLLIGYNFYRDSRDAHAKKFY